MIIPTLFYLWKSYIDKWETYCKEVSKADKEPSVLNVTSKTIQQTHEGQALDKLGLKGIVVEE